VPICTAQVDSCGARLGSLGRPGRTATGTALSDDEGGTASVVSDLRALLVTVGYSTLPFSDEASDVECDVADFDPHVASIGVCAGQGSGAGDRDRTGMASLEG